jgi:hypothetical protein
VAAESGSLAAAWCVVALGTLPTMTMGVWTEVWPVAADEACLWLVSGGDAWRPKGPVAATSQPRADVRSELAARLNVSADALDQIMPSLASTGSRSEEQGLVVTYVAMLDPDGPVRDHWPNAQPVSTDSPAVLIDALRYVRDRGDMELDRDGIERPVVLDETWRRHLSAL